MREKMSNLTRWILHVALLFLLLLLSPANAQSSSNSNTNSTNGRYGYYSNFDPSMAIVIVVLVCVFFIVGSFSVFLRVCSDVSLPADTTSGPRAAATRQHGLEPAVIETFPVFTYSTVKEIKIGRETLECVICLSEFEDDESLRLLPQCNHVFHPECIDAWLLSHVTCPVCRTHLTPPSKEIIKTTGLTPNENDSTPNELQNEVVIAINEEPRNPPPRSGISGKFPRSHSTGHSLVQPGENIERYTLRLPEEVRKTIMGKAKVLKRTASFNVLLLPKEGSSRKGYRSSGSEESSRGRLMIGRSDRWGFLTNPPFVSRGGSVKSLKGDSDGDSVNGRMSVKVPLNCLNSKVREVEEPSVRPSV